MQSDSFRTLYTTSSSRTLPHGLVGTTGSDARVQRRATAMGHLHSRAGYGTRGQSLVALARSR